MLEIERATFPLLVRVRVEGVVTVVLWPSGSAVEKVTLEVESEAIGASPVPLTFTACGLPEALSAILITAERIPSAVGANLA